MIHNQSRSFVEVISRNKMYIILYRRYVEILKYMWSYSVDKEGVSDKVPRVLAPNWPVMAAVH